MRVAFVPMDQRERELELMRGKREEGTNWKRWVAGVAALALIVLVAQNSQKVEVNFFFSSTETPLIFALLIAGLLGGLVGWLAPRVRRHEKHGRED